MQIDWFTLGAQIVNFLVLVFLLKRFLYKPILAAMDKRRQKLAAKFKEAEEKDRAAAEERQRFLALQEELRKSVDEEVLKARREAAKLREQLSVEVRQEIEAARKAWLLGLEKEKKTFLEQTSKTMATQLETLSRAALQELADETLETKMIDKFLGRLAQDSDARQAMIRAAQQETGAMVISSSFGMQEQQRARITAEVQKLFGSKAQLEFKQDKKLIAGVAIEVGGKKVSWDINRYLDEFHDHLASVLERVQTSS